MITKESSLIYISGPITGNENWKEDFSSLATNLRSFGFNVLNPIEEVPDNADTNNLSTWLYYLTKEMDLVSKCDAIVLMQGWKTSKGCQIEKLVAEKFGLKVFLNNPNLVNELNEWISSKSLD